MIQKALLSVNRDSINAVWANSKHTARLLEENGVSVDRVQRYFLTTPFQDIPYPQAPPTAGFVGRLVPEKGVDVLLQAMRLVVDNLPDARLLVAGEGKDEPRLRALCGELGLDGSVEFLGYMEPAKFEAFWRRTHLQVVPSLWAEPFGLVAVEAMAAARAVIATREGGLEESVVEGESGFLVDRADVQQLAHRLLFLLSDLEGCRLMGQRGLGICLERFDNERILEEHLQGYLEVLRRHGVAYSNLTK